MTTIDDAMVSRGVSLLGAGPTGLAFKYQVWRLIETAT
ncbi:hypothetical protein ADILRU_2364 [Leifsonia rubra CMS 76R]|nr:hypothetical protein ADILRU_2364 [Leifsonia rubra CMS 76R]